MKKLLENDKALKVLSVAIAVVLWLYIFIILDPSQTITVRDLPIQFVGMEQLNANGLSVVNESETAITLKVSGSRKRMGRNNMKSIIATVDLSSVAEKGTATLPVDLVVPFENQGIVSQEPYTVDVKVESLVHKELSIEIKTEGSLATDYMAGPMHTAEEKVTISGPESILGMVAGASVVLNYGNADVDIDKELPIRFYTADNKEIVAADSILNRIRPNITKTMVHCTVVKLKRVEISPVFSSNADEETIKSLSYRLSPAYVQIYGDEQITSKINQLQTEEISLEKLTSNQKAKVKIKIPDGVKVLQDIKEVEVTLSEKKGGN